ncbi:MAG: hypothetical protein Q8M22_15190 [Actinomycetota bacterium]|nr:hypothetical protein [Actinomycetota bacterium]
MTRYRFAGVALVAVAIVGCTPESSAPDATLPNVAGDAVLMQLGSYEIGGVPDEFVVGPQIVVYGDGSVFAELDDGAVDGGVSTRLVTGHLDESQLIEVFEAAEALPAEDVVGQLLLDGVPLVLVVGRRQWEVGDRGIEPYREFIDELTDLVDAAAIDVWTPARWILQPYGAPCAVVPDNPDAGPYDAPVYPHVLDEYPPGEC